MKVFISVDMEGATGICSREQCNKGDALYPEGKKLLVADVNAAIEGALAGGAKEIIVADTHNGSHNISPLDIHPEATLLSGLPQDNPRFPFLDSSVDAVFLVAYHAKAGTYWGTLEHTMSSMSWHRLAVNGREIGEVGIDAGLAGSAGVPVVLVTGDDKVCAEARELLGAIETAVVKKGLGRHKAACLSPEKTRKLIFNAAKKALLLKKKIKPLSFGSPVEVSLTYKHTEHADRDHWNCVSEKRVDGYTVVRRYKEFADWYGGVWKERKG